MQREHPGQDSRDVWIEFPGLVVDEELPYLKSRFDQEQIGFRLQPVAEDVTSYGRSYAQALFIRSSDATAACGILRNAYGLRGPRADDAQSGTCPACDTAFVESLSCPSCGLNFGSPFDPDDPRIVFFRRHGGFTE